MVARIIRETDVIEVARPPVLIYGQPGAGKTSMANTANRCLTLDFDKGIHRSEFRKDHLFFGTWEEVVDAQRDGLFESYETIILDTVGTMLRYMSQSIINLNPKNGTRAGGLSQQGWGVLKTTFDGALAALKQQGKQIVMVAHDKEEGDPKKLRPDIAGGSYGIVMQSADVVGYLKYVNNHRWIGFEPTDDYFAKNGARLASAPVPDFKDRPHFLAELLEEARRNLGHTAQASAQIAQAVAQWQEWFSVPELTVESLNMRLPSLAGLPEAAKRQAKALIYQYAQGRGWKLDQPNKCFVAAAAEDDGVNEPPNPTPAPGAGNGTQEAPKPAYDPSRDPNPPKKARRAKT